MLSHLWDVGEEGLALESVSLLVRGTKRNLEKRLMATIKDLMLSVSYMYEGRRCWYKRCASELI